MREEIGRASIYGGDEMYEELKDPRHLLELAPPS